MRVLTSLALCCIGTASVAHAQVSFGFGGGLGAANRTALPNPSFTAQAGFGAGLTLQAFALKPVTGTFAWRLDASINSLPSVQYSGVACPLKPPPNQCCGSCPAGGSDFSFWIASLSLGGELMFTRSSTRPRWYAVGNAGVSYAPQLPSRPWEGFPGVRPAYSFGLGCTLPVSTPTQTAFFEVRFENLLAYHSWYVPLIVGLRF